MRCLNIVTEKFVRNATQNVEIKVNGGHGGDGSAEGGGGGSAGSIRVVGCTFWNLPSIGTVIATLQLNGGTAGLGGVSAMDGLLTPLDDTFFPGPGCVPDP